MLEPGPIVADSGPLIALAAVGQLELLAGLYGTVLIPDAVFREITGFGASRPGAVELSRADWTIRVELEEKPDPLLAEDLGPGESEAIALAVQRHARLLLMDDRRARRIAELAYHVRVKGVAGILVAAKKRGLITSVESLLGQIRSNGYYIAQPIIDRAVYEAGEK